MELSNKIRFKSKQIEYLFRTSEYTDLLKEVCTHITLESSRADNESSIVSIFEIELFSLIKDFFSLKYYPEKERQIDTVRHISKGRIDSKIGALIIEYKHTSKLKSESQRTNASSQLINYLTAVNSNEASDYIGILTDGVQCKVISLEYGIITESAYERLSYKHLDKIIKSIILLEKIALTPENLVKDFTSQDESISNRLSRELFSVLKNQPTGRSLMLFNEWKELFRLAHDDNSKQRAIEERREALGSAIGSDLEGNDDEYLALYAIQTTYAIIVKIIAFKVISKIRYNKSLIDFNALSDAEVGTLRHQMNSLEDGAIFRTLGIGNLLEGDFFAWYCAEKQWTNKVGRLVQEIFKTLTQYEDRAIFQTGQKVQDLFRDLFMKIIPDKVRHSLGEFYTPSWLADNLVREAIAMKGNIREWTALDPCAGSGTFVTVLIKHVLEETKEHTNKQRIDSVLRRVKAIDLNPLAVLTSRINYFINISHLIGDDDEFEIPVYLGDSSYVPTPIKIGNVDCINYSIKTMKGFIEIDLPRSAVNDSARLSKTMTSIEHDIKNLDVDAIQQKISSLVEAQDLTPEILTRIRDLSEQFVDLERNEWNGIWARIVTNFLTTSNLGKFDLIVGNPPWIDWKNLPTGYRERVKALCVERHLFSGDGVTGGINLNICALISNVSAVNWLNSDGVLAFLMPQTIIFQQTYEGFRRFKLTDNSNLYFQQLFDWTKAGHPFNPVTHKFLTYFFSGREVDYKTGIPIKYFKKKSGYDLKDYTNVLEYTLVENIFTETTEIAVQANPATTIFSCAKDDIEMESFKRISGNSYYKGREGIEFYPQELFLLTPDAITSPSKDIIIVRNYQNSKSKYRIPQESFPLEKRYLHPLLKGVDIGRFYYDAPEYIVPFPYDEGNFRSPVNMRELTRQSPLLAKYFNKFKAVFESQTQYNEKIIGERHNTEFYALARVGEYSFAEHFVAFRDNSKWQSCVVSSILTPWGDLRRPQFQNHAVTISQDGDGNFISLEEAHYICAILNAPVTKSYILNSSDSRSFKINPPVFIPKFDPNNLLHVELSDLSIQAHTYYNEEDIISKIDLKLDGLVVRLKD